MQVVPAQVKAEDQVQASSAQGCCLPWRKAQGAREEAAGKAAVWAPGQPPSRKTAFLQKGESRMYLVIGKKAGMEEETTPCWCQVLPAKLKKMAGGEGEPPLHCTRGWG